MPLMGSPPLQLSPDEPPRPRENSTGLGRAALPEAIAFAVGALVRLRLLMTWQADWGYDWISHWAYMDFVARKGYPPPIDGCRTAYHPPLYYYLGALLLRLKASASALVLMSVVMAIAKLAVIWLLLRRFLPHDRRARTIALLLAAVMPALVHLDGMVSNESLNGLMFVVVMELLARTLEVQGAARWRRAGILGLGLAGALLAKVSAMVLLGAIGLGAILEWSFTWGASAPGAGQLWSHASMGLRRALPLGFSVILGLALSLPIYARHYPATGKIIASGYDTRPTEKAQVAEIKNIPYWKRRDLSFIVGLGTTDIFKTPYWPTEVLPQPRFLPVLLASSYSDYYNYRFDGEPKTGEPYLTVNQRPWRRSTLNYARASVIGGFVITLLLVAATVPAILALYRRREAAALALLAVPYLAVLGQLHFAIQYPIDLQGPIKGVYLQCAVAPWFALFGVAVAWLWRRRWGRGLAILQLCAVAAVASYTLHALRLF